MLAIERRNQIEQIIMQNKTVLVTELARQFDVSAETIRGDLEKLEKQGLLVRTYGGASLKYEDELEPSVVERENVNYLEKQIIGKKAADMIDSGDTVFLDASTSALHLARNIKTKRGLTVITNAVKIVEELSSCNHISVMCVGGQLNSRNFSFVGRVAEKLIKENYAADKFFFSCKGVTVERGLMDFTEGEAEIKKAMISVSKKRIFLCDTNKIGRLGMQAICGFNDVDVMITDAELDGKMKNALDKNGVETVTV